MGHHLNQRPSRDISSFVLSATRLFTTSYDTFGWGSTFYPDVWMPRIVGVECWVNHYQSTLGLEDGILDGTYVEAGGRPRLEPEPPGGSGQPTGDSRGTSAVPVVRKSAKTEAELVRPVEVKLTVQSPV